MNCELRIQMLCDQYGHYITSLEGVKPNGSSFILKRNDSRVEESSFARSVGFLKSVLGPELGISQRYSKSHRR
jgi:hypothetical protein